MSDYDFSMLLRVSDVEALCCAALEHDDAQPDQTFRHDDGTVDIDTCLVMILDPGSLPGCSIQSSSAAAAEVPEQVELETHSLRM